MKGPSGVLWPKIIKRKKITKIRIIGIIHQSLFLAKKLNKFLRVESLIATDLKNNFIFFILIISG